MVLLKFACTPDFVFVLASTAYGNAKCDSHLQKLGTVVNCEYGVDLRYARRPTGTSCFLIPKFDTHSTIRIRDGGDIPYHLSQDESYRALSAEVRKVISQGGIPFVVGGGNDQSYANARGALDCSHMFVILVAQVYVCA
jgi:hypothetical protein